MHTTNKILINFFAFFALVIVFTGCNASADESRSNKGNTSQIYTNSDSYNNNDIQFSKIQNEISNSRRNAITNTVAKCSPAIVGINITEVQEVRYNSHFDEMFSLLFGKRQQEVKGLGSGFIISSDGYILTNHHVAGNATKVVVTLTNGEKYDAQIIGADMVSDVCLLKISTNKKLPYLKFANSNDVIVGEWAIAFGNPFGLFNINSKPSITVGVVSNKDINFFQNNGRAGYSVYKNMLQTDAAISSGNSGGPLINSLGEVIGMNTVIFSTATSRSGAGSIGIGFAIPINRVKSIVDMLKDGKKIERNANTGIEINEITPEISRYFKFDKDNGVYVERIYRSSPAEKAGIEPGDIILKINGAEINHSDDFFIAIADAFVGDKLAFEILRGSKTSKHTIKVEKNKY